MLLAGTPKTAKLGAPTPAKNRGHNNGGFHQVQFLKADPQQ